MEIAPTNKIPALNKSMNMDIWVLGTSNQLRHRKSLYWNKIFRKNKVVTGKSPLFEIGSFCTPHSIVLTLASDWVVLCGNEAFPVFRKKYFRSPENLFQS